MCVGRARIPPRSRVIRVIHFVSRRAGTTCYTLSQGNAPDLLHPPKVYASWATPFQTFKRTDEPQGFAAMMLSPEQSGKYGLVDIVGKDLSLLGLRAGESQFIFREMSPWIRRAPFQQKRGPMHSPKTCYLSAGTGLNLYAGVLLLCQNAELCTYLSFGA